MTFHLVITIFFGSGRTRNTEAMSKSNPVCGQHRIWSLLCPKQTCPCCGQNRLPATPVLLWGACCQLWEHEGSSRMTLRLMEILEITSDLSESLAAWECFKQRFLTSGNFLYEAICTCTYYIYINRWVYCSIVHSWGNYPEYPSLEK